MQCNICSGDCRQVVKWEYKANSEVALSFLTVFSSQAIERGDQSTIEEWLKDKDTKVNECRGGTALSPPFAVANGTALHWAVYYGQLDIAQLLLDKGAGMYICFY